MDKEYMDNLMKDIQYCFDWITVEGASADKNLAVQIRLNSILESLEEELDAVHAEAEQ